MHWNDIGLENDWYICRKIFLINWRELLSDVTI